MFLAIRDKEWWLSVPHRGVHKKSYQKRHNYCMLRDMKGKGGFFGC